MQVAQSLFMCQNLTNKYIFSLKVNNLQKKCNNVSKVKNAMKNFEKMHKFFKKPYTKGANNVIMYTVQYIYLGISDKNTQGIIFTEVAHWKRLASLI